MAEVINLRLARKARVRSAAQAEAAENRARHGRPKAEKRKQQDAAERSARLLDLHRREEP